MNKLGFYTVNFGVGEVVEAIKTVQPRVLLGHLDFKDAFVDLRKTWSPDTFVVGRPFVFTPHQQDQMLDSDDPVGHGIRWAERILSEFPIATERINGRLVVDAWMLLNESVRGPSSFPPGHDHNAPDYQEMVRRAAAYDALERAFQNRLAEQGLQAVAFNFGAGNWMDGEDYLKHFPKTLASHRYLGFHEYGWPNMDPAQPNTGSACGTYRRVMGVIRAEFGSRHRVIITEAGLARAYVHPRMHPDDNRPQGNADVGWLYPWDTVAEESYKRSLRWYNGLLVEDDYVEGACLFQVGTGPGWDTFRHTGVDYQGRPLTLMDELRAMAQEPAPEPFAPAPLSELLPERSLVETLREIGEPLVIPLNPDAALYKVARQNDLGERLTGEYEGTYQEQSYLAQLYERGLVYAPVGLWDQVEVVPTPRIGTLGVLSVTEVTRPEVAWTLFVTGFHGNRWNYWEQRLAGKIPGYTWHMFMDDVVEHNPQLEADGFIFKPEKTYEMPGVEDQVVTGPTRPIGVTPQVPSEFVQLSGDKFQVRGKPTRFIGVNIRGLVHYGHDPVYFAHAPREHRDIQLSAANNMNARLVRVFLAHRDATPDQIVSRLREVLELIRTKYPDLYLLPALTNLYNDVPFYVKGDDRFYVDHPGGGKQRLSKAFFEDGYRENYLPFVKQVVTAFRDEPHIFAWEIGNELKAEREPELFVRFNRSVAAAIKSQDPRHLVTTGMISTRHAWMQGMDELRRDLYGSPHIDFVTIHAYNGNEDPNAIEDDSDMAREFGKPFIIEEAGFDLDRYSNRPEKTRTDLANWFRKGASCYMPWGFVATQADNNDGDRNVGMTGPLIPDWRELYLLFQQCGNLLLNTGPTQDVSAAIANINFQPAGVLSAELAATLPAELPATLPWPLVVDGFDFPVGVPDGRGYYVAADLVDQSYYAERGAWHTGEDWNRRLGPGDSPDVDLGDPVYAVAHGRVVTSYSFPSWGNIVLIEHRLPTGDTVWSQYAHLRQRLVSKGDVVRRGDRIGSIGKGENDRYLAHLHFEIRLKDLPASKWGWNQPEDRELVLEAYAPPTNFINSYRPR